MEGFDLRFRSGRKPTFDDAPRAHRRRLFGQDYLHLRGLQGGELLITRCGWPLAESLLPDQWFVGRRFSKVGRALAGATGAVYHVPTPHRRCPRLGLVVKFSRFGQSVNMTVTDAKLAADAELRSRVEDARFLSPLEEFAHVMRLRSGPGPRVHAAQPLAVYSPPTRYAEWELGRSRALFRRHDHRLLESQDQTPEQARYAYDPERIYILLYRWTEGIDAEQACQQGLLTDDEMRQLTVDARQAIRDNGWLILDHKPRHVIVRPNRDGSRLRRRHGEPIWAVVDYELLVPREPEADRASSDPADDATQRPQVATENCF